MQVSGLTKWAGVESAGPTLAATGERTNIGKECKRPLIVITEMLAEILAGM